MPCQGSWSAGLLSAPNSRETHCKPLPTRAPALPGGKYRNNFFDFSLSAMTTHRCKNWSRACPERSECTELRKLAVERRGERGRGEGTLLSRFPQNGETELPSRLRNSPKRKNSESWDDGYWTTGSITGRLQGTGPLYRTGSASADAGRRQS